jgi:hypothetical protein
MACLFAGCSAVVDEIVVEYNVGAALDHSRRPYLSETDCVNADVTKFVTSVDI